MDNSTKRPAFSLSQEELFVILTYLKVPSLTGLDNRVLAELSEEQARLILGVAERALIARGFLVPGSEHRLGLEAAVLAMVGACATPEKSLIVTRSRPQAPPEAYFFHTARKMTVLHTTPMTAIHQFVMLEDLTALWRSAMNILALDASDAILKCPPGQLPEAFVSQARDAAQEKGGQEALKILSQTQLDSQTAEQFAATLANPTANTTLVFIEAATSKADGFTLLQGPNGTWLLKPVGNGSSIDKPVFLKPLAKDEISGEVKALVGLS